MFKIKEREREREREHQNKLRDCIKPLTRNADRNLLAK